MAPRPRSHYHVTGSEGRKGGGSTWPNVLTKTHAGWKRNWCTCALPYDRWIMCPYNYNLWFNELLSAPLVTFWFFYLTITLWAENVYLNNGVFLSRSYRLIVAPQKLNGQRSQASRANVLVLRTWNFQGRIIRPIVPRHTHSIVHIVHN